MFRMLGSSQDRVVLQKGALYRNFPPKSLSLQCYPGRRKLQLLIFLDPKDQDEGTFAKATLLQNRGSSFLSRLRFAIAIKSATCNRRMPAKSQPESHVILWSSVSRTGGRNKGGRKQMRANADKQTQTNASKRRGENASKRKQTRANVDKRKQTLTPPFIAVFLHPPLQSP